jgi:hypothetical protein
MFCRWHHTNWGTTNTTSATSILLSAMTKRIALVVVGGLSFWGPVTLLEVLVRTDLDFITSNVLPVATLFACYRIVMRKQKQQVRAAAVWMLWGVYALGWLFIYTGATAHGGGFSKFAGWSDIKGLLYSLVNPLITLMASFAGASGLGVVSATMLMLWLDGDAERKRRDAVVKQQ